MRRFLPFLLGGVLVAVFAAGGWAIAAAIDGDDAGEAAAPPVWDEADGGATPRSVALPLLSLNGLDPDEPPIDEASLDVPLDVVLEEPPEGDGPAGVDEDVSPDAPDGSDTPVPTRRDIIEAAAAHDAAERAVVTEPSATPLPEGEEAIEDWRDTDGSDADADVGTEEAGIDAGSAGIVETDEDGAPLGEDAGDRGDDRILDICAGPEPVEGCPEGVGGTVSMAIVGPFDIIEVVAGADEHCTVEAGRDRFTATIRSSAPGHFVIRATPVGEPTRPVIEVDTSAAERSRWESDESVVVQTCVAFPVESGDTEFHVEILGVQLEGDGAGDGWVGNITPVHPDRASVRFVPVPGRVGRNDLLALVTSRPDEQVEVRRVLREPGQTTSACERLDELIAAGRTLVHDQQPYTGGWFGIAPTGSPDFPSVHSFEMRDVGTGLNDICITWYRDLAPTREVVERRSWMVTPPMAPSLTIGLREIRPAAGAGREPGGVGVWVHTTGGRELCRDWVPTGDELMSVCEVHTVHDVEMLALQAEATYSGAAADRFSSLLPIQQGPCRFGDCGGWARLSLPGPGGGPGTDVVIDLRYRNPDLSSLPVGWRLSAENWEWRAGESFGDDSERNTAEADLPRLDVGQTRLEYDQAEDPFLIKVHWYADRPVVATARGWNPEERSCSSDLSPGMAGLRRGPVSTPATSGVLEMHACPGTRHQYAIRLEEPGGAVSVFSSASLPQLAFGEGEPDYGWPEGQFTTPPLELDVRYGVRARLGGWTGYVLEAPGRHQPERAHVDWWTEMGTFRFNQSRRSGFIVHNSPTCDALTNFDVAPEGVAPTPVRVSAGPRVHLRVEAGITTYSSCRLFTHVPTSDPTYDTGIVMYESVPVKDLLEQPFVTVSKRGYPAGYPDRPTCHACVPWVYADVSATQAPRS